MRNYIYNSAVNISGDDTVSRAADRFLSRIYYARNKPSIGGYETWLELIDLYYSLDYDRIVEIISGLSGAGASVRKACLHDVEILRGTSAGKGEQ